VITSSRSFFGLGKNGTEHNSISASGKGFTYLATFAKATIGN
jgi:hypothetical protein